MALWTDDRVETLKRDWADGLSGSQIAARLGGVTRNAVIGKAHRLGLVGKASTRTLTARPRRVSQRNLRPTRVQHRPNGNAALKPVFVPVEQPTVVLVIVPKVVEELDAPMTLRVNLLDLREHMCRWPLDRCDYDVGAFQFCGRHRTAGIAYCDHHARLAFRPVARRKKSNDRR